MLCMQARDEKEKQEAERLKPEKDRQHSWWNPFGHSDTKDSKVPEKESSSWFSSPAKATEPEKKHWYDFMSAHQDRTKQTRAGVLKAAMTGKDADVAKAVSEDATASVGGDWGWVKRTEMIEEIKTALTDLPVDTISKPVYTPEGYYLLQIEERREASTKTLTEVRNEIEEELRQEESGRLYRNWMERLRKKHSVLYFIPRPDTSS